MMHQMYSIGERSGLQAGQFSTRTLLLRRHAVVIAAVCGSAFSCWNRHCLEGSICCSKTFMYIPFSIHSALQNMKAVHTVWTYAPPIPSEMLAFELNANIMLKRSPSSLARRTRRRDFQQECQIWTLLTIEHISILKRSILNEPWPRGQNGASGPSSHIASFLHDRALVDISR